MNNTFAKLCLIITLTTTANLRLLAQGSFVNLDFETPTFVPIPGDPYGRVQFDLAMPGWTGYLGSSPIDWILHNNLFLSSAGISIHGPDYPRPGLSQGHYYVMLQNSFPVATDVPAIAQTGIIPLGTRSIRFLSDEPYAVGLRIFFAGNLIPVSLLGTNGNDLTIWGGDISAFAGQTGELRFRGAGFLDYIQFSPSIIPEPGSVSLLAAGVLLLGWRFSSKRPWGALTCGSTK